MFIINMKKDLPFGISFTYIKNRWQKMFDASQIIYLYSANPTRGKTSFIRHFFIINPPPQGPTLLLVRAYI